MLYGTAPPLKKEVYAGKRFTVRYSTNGYYDICPSAHGFRITYTPFETPLEKSFDDVFFGEWLEQPIAFGAFMYSRMSSKHRRLLVDVPYQKLASNWICHPGLV